MAFGVKRGEASVDTGREALDLLSGLKGALADRVGDRLPIDRLPKGRWRRRPDDPDDAAA